MPVELEWGIILLSLALGGILKGASGVGAPILAVPVMAAAFDVPFAISVMVLPNFVMNVWQIWHFRADAPDAGFMAMLIAGGMVGVLAGTLLLTSLPQEALTLVVAILLVLYIGLRLARPNLSIAPKVGRWLSAPGGLVSGLLQGATGLSAPASITFLNALRLKRETFIFTISSLFTAFGVVQMPALMAVGVLDGPRLLLSAGAIVPVLVAMPFGALVARRIGPAAFDRFILLILAGIALKLLIEAAFGL